MVGRKYRAIRIRMPMPVAPPLAITMGGQNSRQAGG
jgi:hypothetical protein